MSPKKPPHSRAKKLTQLSREAKALVSRFGPPLFKADAANLAFSADKEGRVRMVYAGWDDPKVLEPGSHRRSGPLEALRSRAPFP